jgi:hypothetical protein
MISWFQKILLQIQLVPLHLGGLLKSGIGGAIGRFGGTVQFECS